MTELNTPRMPELRVGANTVALSPISSASRKFGPGALAWALFVLVVLSTVAVDRLSKDAVGERLVYRADRRLLGPLSLTDMTNRGIAFGLFPTATGLIAVIGFIALAAMVVLFARIGGDAPGWRPSWACSPAERSATCWTVCASDV